MTRRGFNYLVGHRFYQTEIILKLACVFFFDNDKITFNIFVLVLYDPSVSVSFSQNTPQKSIFVTAEACVLVFCLLSVDIKRQMF